MEKLQKNIFYQFNDIDLLKQALTHRSVSKKNNERLEFLGDSILGCVISRELYQRFPLIDEGQLSRLRSYLVRGQTLAKLAKTIKLSETLVLGQGELKSGGFRRESIQADAFEAILGAIFLDSDYLTVSSVVLELYKEVVDRVRSSETDVILNLTTGMGGDLEIGSGKNPLDVGPNTDMANIMERIANAEQCLPEICSLDCGSLNFGDNTMLAVNTPNDIRKAAKRLKEIDVKPEIEAFDLGNMWFGTQLVKEGLIKDPPLFQICLGIPWGAPATPSAMKAFVDIMPEGSHWSGFAISKMEMPYVAQTILLGGNVRVGLEDNIYLKKGVLASNAQLVEKAIRIITDMGATTLTPEETRQKLKLKKHK